MHRVGVKSLLFLKWFTWKSRRPTCTWIAFHACSDMSGLSLVGPDVLGWTLSLVGPDVLGWTLGSHWVQPWSRTSFFSHFLVTVMLLVLDLSSTGILLDLHRGSDLTCFPSRFSMWSITAVKCSIDLWLDLQLEKLTCYLAQNENKPIGTQFC